nr:MAG TPA: hypothetical protein [Caudoviricetes sp.]
MQTHNTAILRVCQPFPRKFILLFELINSQSCDIIHIVRR